MAVKPETVFRTPWFEIAKVDPGAETSGTTDPYYVLVRRNGVIGLVLDDAGRVVLISQYRPPLGRQTLEMPAGTIDSGETPKQAMAREILEETGHICETLVPIAPCRLMLNRENVIEYFFVGLGARPATDFARKERAEVRLIARPEFWELVVSKRFEQTVALGGMYMAETIFDLDLIRDPIATIRSRLAGAPEI
jgi:ADP-ribose pyrophosphatase